MNPKFTVLEYLLSIAEHNIIIVDFDTIAVECSMHRQEVIYYVNKLCEQSNLPKLQWLNCLENLGNGNYKNKWMIIE